MGEYMISDFGTIADDETLQTTAIQAAIDACALAGGGVVVCGSGVYRIGTITLRSHVELFLSPGCVLRGSSDLTDYEDFDADGFRPEHAAEGNTKCLIRGSDLHDVAITGPGVVDGAGIEFYDTDSWSGRFFSKPPTPRPRMLMLFRCTDVRIESASFLESPCWTFWIMQCDRVSIRGIRIRGDQRMINNDGIDIDSCRDVTISDCIIKTADDCIVIRAIDNVFDEPAACERVTVTNCTLDSWCQCVRIGCPGDGTIRNATLSNLTMRSANNGINVDHPKRYLPEGNTGSADIHDIIVSGVTIECENRPIRVHVEDGIALTRLSDMVFSDIRIRSGGPVVVSGSDLTVVRNIRFAGVSVETRAEPAFELSRCQAVSLDQVVVSSTSDIG